MTFSEKPMHEAQQTPAVQYRLAADNGSEFLFCGRMFSETSFFDEENGSLTRLRLFVTEQNDYVYSIVSVIGAHKSRRHYKIKPNGAMCEMTDGIQPLIVPTEVLFSAVFGLCGIDPAHADAIRPSLEESLRVASVG